MLPFLYSSKYDLEFWSNGSHHDLLFLCIAVCVCNACMHYDENHWRWLGSAQTNSETSCPSPQSHLERGGTGGWGESGR